MAQLTQTQLTMAKQIGAKELRFAKFNMMVDGDNTIHVQKGNRSVIITYNPGSDLYTVRLFRHHNFDVKQDETIEGVYADQLRGFIQNHFPRFEYVMDQFRGWHND